MKLPDAAHTSQPWRIHELAGDLELEDVWALPTPGGPDDFPRLVELFDSFDPATDAPAPVRALFALRFAIGRVLGWDRADGVEAFEPMYETDDEWAAEIENKTVRGVLHLGWVADDEAEGGYRGQMAVLVRRKGLLGTAYMAAITPFRYLVVYPMMLETIGRKWREDQVADSASARRSPVST